MKDLLGSFAIGAAIMALGVGVGYSLGVNNGRADALDQLDGLAQAIEAERAAAREALEAADAAIDELNRQLREERALREPVVR